MGLSTLHTLWSDTDFYLNSTSQIKFLGIINIGIASNHLKDAIEKTIRFTLDLVINDDCLKYKINILRWIMYHVRMLFCLLRRLAQNKREFML